MQTHLATFVAAAVVSSAIAISPSTPKILSIAPAAPVPGPSAQVLTVTGQEFAPGVSLDVTTANGGTRHFQGNDIQAPRATSFQVSMTFATAGTYSFVVTNPDGGASEAFPLKVQPSAVAPVIDAVSPSKPMKQQGTQTLRIDGQRFAPGLMVNVTDPTGETTKISGADVGQVTPNSCEVSVVLSMGGDYEVAVTNPDGAYSNAVSVNVTTYARRVRK